MYKYSKRYKWVTHSKIFVQLITHGKSRKFSHILPCRASNSCSHQFLNDFNLNNFLIIFSKKFTRNKLDNLLIDSIIKISTVRFRLARRTRIILTRRKRRAQDENPEERSVPGDPSERLVVGSVRQAVAAGAVVLLDRLQPGLAMPKHEEHLRDERTLHSQECHRHEGADLPGGHDRGDATLQTGCTLHLRCHVAESEGLRAEGDTVPLLGDSGRGQLPGPAERRRHCPGHSGNPVGVGRWYRKHFGTTGTQVSSEGRRD